VTDEDAIAKGVEETVKELGSIDMLLCFAGVVATEHAEKVPASQFRRVLDINTTGSWLCAQAVGR
jgi:sorbose reductase